MAEPRLGQFKARLVSMSPGGKKAQVIVHYKDEAGTKRSRTRHIVKGPDGWTGRSLGYYDEFQGPFMVKGDLSKHSEAKKAMEEAEAKLKAAEKPLEGLRARQRAMEEAFALQGEELSVFDQLAAEVITEYLVAFAATNLDLAGKAFAQSQANLREVQENHPLEAIYSF